MADFQIHGRMLVKTLKEQFFNEFGGVLRVYNGNKKANDDDTLAAIRANDAAKGGELTCRANRTVGKFEQEMWDVFGIKVQVATKDDWVLVLDGITLNTIKEIPKNATREIMEKFLAYQRNKEEKAEEVSENVNTGLSDIDEIYDVYWDMQYGTEQDGEIDPQYTVRELFSEIAYNADCDELDEFTQLANFVLKHNQKIENDRMFAFLTFAAELLQGWIDKDDDEEVLVFKHEDIEIFKGTAKELYEKYEKFLSDDVIDDDDDQEDDEDESEADYSDVLEILNGEHLAYIPIDDYDNPDVVGVPPFNKDWKTAWDLDDLYAIFPYMEDDGEYAWEPVRKIDLNRDGFYYAYEPEWGLYSDKGLGVYVVDGKIACVLFKDEEDGDRTKIRIGNQVLEQE